jgi:hypothetical protein
VSHGVEAGVQALRSGPELDSVRRHDAVQLGNVDRGGVGSGKVKPVEHFIWRLPCHWFVVDTLVSQELVRVFVECLGEFWCEVAREVGGLGAKSAVV